MLVPALAGAALILLVAAVLFAVLRMEESQRADTLQIALAKEEQRRVQLASDLADKQRAFDSTSAELERSRALVQKLQKDVALKREQVDSFGADLRRSRKELQEAAEHIKLVSEAEARVRNKRVLDTSAERVARSYVQALQSGNSRELLAMTGERLYAENAVFNREQLAAVYLKAAKKANTSNRRYDLIDFHARDPSFLYQSSPYRELGRRLSQMGYRSQPGDRAVLITYIKRTKNSSQHEMGLALTRKRGDGGTKVISIFLD